jgi:hypothetical protein
MSNGMPKRVYIVGAVWLAVAATAPQASALEYCVTCEGPPAMYRCVIDGTADGAGKDPSASLHCISEMATRGKHQQCAVSRGAPFPCPGLTAMVQPPKGMPAPPAAASADAPRPGDLAPRDVTTAPEHAEPPKPEPSKVPRTVEELAGQTVRSSQEGLKQAGDAIGGTAKKAGEQIGNAGSAIGNAATTTWNCLTSLFSSCSSQNSGSAPAHPEEGDQTTTAAGEHRPN